MPIRDINNYLLNCKSHDSTSNRGASGIDGLTSTAFGWMIGNNQPTLLIIGDLSLMHDWGVLFTLAHLTLPQPLVIVVINNGGGGIFSIFLSLKKRMSLKKSFCNGTQSSIHSYIESHGHFGTHCVNDGGVQFYLR